MIVAALILLLLAIAIGTAADSGKVLGPPITHGPANGGTGIPGSIRQYSGTPQFATVGTAYRSLLVHGCPTLSVIQCPEYPSPSPHHPLGRPGRSCHAPTPT
jgi:hypothetical protein